MNDKEKMKEDELTRKSIIMIKSIKEQMKLSEFALKANDNELQQNGFCHMLNFSDPNLELPKLEQNFREKPSDAIFDDNCSICQSKIYYSKYICIICKDCILCPKCEIDHIHPTLKCKYPQLSKPEDIFTYIHRRNNEFKNMKNNMGTGFLSSIFTAKFELSLECEHKKLTMRPYHRISVPVTIKNLSSTDFDGKQNGLILFGRNIQDLKVYTTNIYDKIEKSKEIETFVDIESSDKMKKINFTLELFSLKSDKFKSNSLNFIIDINNDEEEERLNSYFYGYPKLIVEPKDVKKGVKEVYEAKQQTKKFDYMVILDFFKKNNGNVQETIKALSY